MMRAMMKAAGKAEVFDDQVDQRLMPPHVRAKEILDSRKLGRRGVSNCFQTSGEGGRWMVASRGF
jgi:hypothetical protein